jgi:hypothetical protein
MSGENADRISGAVYRLLAERGRNADAPVDSDWLRSCGLGPSEAGEVKAILDLYRRKGVVPPKPARLQGLIAEHAPDVDPTTMALAQAENAFYRGMAAALFHSAAKWGAGFPEDVATAFGNEAAAPAPLPTAVPHEVPPLPTAPSAANAEPEQKAAVQASIADLAEKLCATKLQLREWTDKTCRQMRQTAGLLVKVVGHDDLTRIKQADAGAEPVDERTHVRFSDILFPKAASMDLRLAQRLDLARDQHHLLDAEAGVDGLQPLVEEPGQMSRVPVGPGCADPQALF